MRIFRYLRGGVALACLSFSSVSVGEPPKLPNKAPEVHLGGHSLVGEVFNEGPRQAAKLISGTGAASFDLSTKNAEAKKFFNQGLGQLYGFWNYEAERSFRQAAKLDPKSPMPYWGMAMANIVFDAGSLKRAHLFSKEMGKRRDNGDACETQWVDGLAALFDLKGAVTKETRKAWADSLMLTGMANCSPVEAKALEALVRWENFGFHGVAIDALSVDKLLDDVFKEVPNHPAHHFRIHLWNGRDAKKALASAKECGPAAPGVAHMWHMPGHIYAELRDYNNAAWHQEASARVDHAYMKKSGVMPYEIHNYAHNNEWGTRSLILAGAATKALALAKNLTEIPAHPTKNPADESGSVLSYGPSRVRQVIKTFEMWEEGKKLLNSPYLDLNAAAGADFYDLKFLSRLYFGLSDAAGLKKVEERLTKSKDQYRPNDFKTLTEELTIHLLLTDGKRDEAYALLDKASDELDYDYLVPLLIADKKFDLALKRTKDELKPYHPKVVFPPKILALHAAGKKEEAKKVFEVLRTDSLALDLNAVPFKRLAAVAADLGYPADWRLPGTTTLEARPELEKLGPLTWSPNPAPALKLLDANSKEVDLASYAQQGKPVLVVFYLGSRCLKCVEQLKALLPETEKFEKAGISIVAVGTDKPEKVAEWNARVEKETGKGFPFPMLSDSAKTAFKAFGAYDDFEEFPLHGLYLVDAKGKLRWQEVSTEPFLDFKFLLGESKRLLSLSN